MKITSITKHQAISAVIKHCIEERSIRDIAREMQKPHNTLARILKWIQVYGIIDTFDPDFIPPQRRQQTNPEVMAEMLDKNKLWERALFGVKKRHAKTNGTRH